MLLFSIQCTLLKIKVLHDAIEEPFDLNGSIKNLKQKEMFFKEPLTQWFFVEPNIVLLWHRFEEPSKHIYL